MTKTHPAFLDYQRLALASACWSVAASRDQSRETSRQEARACAREASAWEMAVSRMGHEAALDAWSRWQRTLPRSHPCKSDCDPDGN